MAYLVPCKMYVADANNNEVYVGKRSLRVPRVIHGSGTDSIVHTFQSSWFSYYDFSCPNPLGLAGIATNEINTDTYYFSGFRYIIFEIISSDDIVRRIKVEIYLSSQYSDRDHTMGFNIEYIKDGDTIFSTNLPWSAYSDIYNTNWSQTVCQCIMKRYSVYWLGTDDNGTEKLYCLQPTASYLIKNDGSEDPYDVFGEYNYYALATPDRIAEFKQWLSGYEPREDDGTNPFSPGGTTDIGGGGGNFSEDSDTPTTDSLPSISAIGSGMATVFKPSVSQLRALADVMWNSNFFTFMQNLVENISDMFISLAIVPFQVTAGSTVSVRWLGFDTAVSLTLAAQQYYEFDMGSINLSDDSRVYSSGSALDYSPFSRLGIYLPFIGYQELDIDECRDAVMRLRYRIDILSGSCVAIISLNGKDIYQFSGNCLSQIPITNENMQSLVSDAVNIGIAATTASKAQAALGAAESEWGAASTEGDIAKANTQIAHASAHLTSSRAQLASASANSMMGMKPSFGKAGSIGASCSLLAVKQPYLFLTTPRQAIPENYQKYCGFPSNITGRLYEFSGYTVVEDIRLNDLVATSPEVAEIYELLKKGVII